MPKNKGAGGKKRRKGRTNTLNTRELVYKDENQEYGRAIKSLGNGYMAIQCMNGAGDVGDLRRAHIRGKMRKKVWITLGDVVLVSVRDYHTDTCDIILKYTADEIRILKSRKEIPMATEIEKKDMNEENITFHFEENEDDSSDEEPTVTDQNRNYDLPPEDEDEEYS